MLLVDDTQILILGQSYIRYRPGGGVAHARGVLLVDQTVDQFTPVAGTEMRQ